MTIGQAEVDRGKGMAVILFHVEASLDNMVFVSKYREIISNQVKFVRGDLSCCDGPG